MLATGSITAYQSRSNTIAIIDDGKVTQYETLDVYVGDVLENQEIIIGEKDKLSHELDEKIKDGDRIFIHRWKPTVSVDVNGVTYTFKTSQKTVGELLEDRRIQLTEESHVSAPLDAELTDGMDIKVKTKEVTTEIVQENIPFETEVKQTKELKYGEEKIVKEGKNGKKETVKEVVRFGGEIVSETVKEETVLVEPQTQVVKQGMKNTIVDEQTGRIFEYRKVLTMEATAYTHQPGDRWYNKTASGLPTFVGMVAVDRNVIPLGTVLYVEGYGIAIAGDVGGAIKGLDIDLYFNTPTEVRNFGRRNKTVYILEDQSIDVLALRGVR